MFRFNFRDIGHKDRYDDLSRAIDKASKANLALVAMKTQDGAANFPDKMAELKAKGFKKEVAAIKTVWMDHRMHVAVSEMTTRDDLRENIAGSQNVALTARNRASREIPPGDSSLVLPRLQPALRTGRRRDRRRRHPPLLPLRRGLRQAPASSRALPGTTARGAHGGHGRPCRRAGRVPPRLCRLSSSSSEQSAAWAESALISPRRIRLADRHLPRAPVPSCRPGSRRRRQSSARGRPNDSAPSKKETTADRRVRRPQKSWSR